MSDVGDDFQVISSKSKTLKQKMPQPSSSVTSKAKASTGVSANLPPKSVTSTTSQPPKKSQLDVQPSTSQDADILDFTEDDFHPASKHALKRRTLVPNNPSYSDFHLEMHMAPFSRLGPESVPTHVMDVILDAAEKVRNVLVGRGKSVTKMDKAEVLRLVDGIDASVMLLKKNILKSPIDLDETVADVVQTEMEKFGTLNVQTIRDLLREEMDAFREEIRNDIKTSSQVQQTSAASFASVTARNTYRPPKTPVSRPALVLSSGSTDVKNHKDVLQA